MYFVQGNHFLLKPMNTYCIVGYVFIVKTYINIGCTCMCTVLETYRPTVITDLFDCNRYLKNTFIT